MGLTKLKKRMSRVGKLRLGRTGGGKDVPIAVAESVDNTVWTPYPLATAAVAEEDDETLFQNRVGYPELDGEKRAVETAVNKLSNKSYDFVSKTKIVREDKLRFPTRQQETYLVRLGVVDFLQDALNAVCGDRITFVVGEVQNIKPMREPYLDAYTPAYIRALKPRSGAMSRPEKFTVPLDEPRTVILNKYSRGISMLAGRAVTLFRQSPSVSENTELGIYLRRCVQLLENLSSLPSWVPGMGLGSPVGFQADFRPGNREEYMMPPIAWRGDFIGTTVFFALYDQPGLDFEEALVRESLYNVLKDDIVRNGLGLEGTGVVAYSPTFLRLSSRFETFNPSENVVLGMSMFFGFPMIVDRTETVHDPVVHTTVLDSIPEIDGPAFSEGAEMKVTSFNKIADAYKACQQHGVEKLMQETVADAIARAKETMSRSIQILWDCSVESTALLAAFLSERPESYKLANVRVYVIFFERLVKGPKADHLAKSIYQSYLGGLQGRVPRQWQHVLNAVPIKEGGSSFAAYLSLESSLVVHAAHAEHIFGSSVYRTIYTSSPLGSVWSSVTRSDFMGQLWRHVLPDLLQECNAFDDIQYQRILELITELASKAPFELQTLRDLLWWMSFTLDWQRASLSHAFEVGFLDPALFVNMFSFYGSDEWQKWAMQPQNHSIKFPNPSNLYTYKALLKGYIAKSTFGKGVSRQSSFWRDKLWTKTDVFAWQCKSSSFLAVDDNFHIISAGANSILDDDLRMRYGSTLSRYFV